MPQKKTWTVQQDRILKKLFEQQKIAKWSKIAQKMSEEYHFPGRNGKQCRQRYQTVLQPSFQFLQWTEQEERQMYELHDELGNKWAMIAQRMKGRTDNCVKNHFYSNLRKAIRKLNKVLTQNFKSKIKQIRPIVLYKIIQASDKFLQTSQTSEEHQQKCQRIKKIKNKLLLLSNDNCSFQNDFDQLKLLGEQIQIFNKDYKRKAKKDRRGVAQSQNLMKVPKIDKFKCPSEPEDSESQLSMDLSQRDSIQIGERKEEEKKQNVIIHKIKQVIEVSKSCHLQDSSQYKGIQMVLKNAGILFDGPQKPLMGKSIQESYNSDFYCNQFGQKSRNQNDGFNLNQSTEKFKGFLALRHSGEVEEDKLFRSLN